MKTRMLFSGIKNIRSYALTVILLSGTVICLSSGCSKVWPENAAAENNETEESSEGRGRAELTTDTRSDSFVDQDEKLAFLETYLIMPSEVIDAEYHIIYWDNSGGLVAGPSDWDIRAVLQVASEDVPLWTKDMKRIIREQMDPELWSDLKSEELSWDESEFWDYYKRPGSRSYIAVNKDQNIILKYVSTTYYPSVADSESFIQEIPGYEEGKGMVADVLGYDQSVTPYIRTIQAEKVLLESGEEAELICYRALFYDSPLYGNTVMIIKTGDQITGEILCEGSYEDDFSLADIDGDGNREMLTRHCVTITGGAGGYKTAVYKISEAGLNKIFEYPDWENKETFDTGFMLTIADGYNFNVENRYTGYNTEFTNNKMDHNLYFDQNGDLTEGGEEHNRERKLGIDASFHLFEPTDNDHDGVSEIKTAQYTYLGGRLNGLGVAYCILKWNSDKNTFEITETQFEPF